MAKTLLEPNSGALKPKRAVGRPMKAPRRGKRAPLSLLVRPETKRLVDRLATRDGTTQSAMAEYLIEQGIAVRQVLDAMGKTLEEIEQGNTDGAMRRRGYVSHRIMAGGRTWLLWTEPGFPIPTSGFKPWGPGELKALYPDYDETAPVSEAIQPPPVPPEFAGVDPDLLYLVAEPGGGWKWAVAKRGRQEGETK
jgi:hypothetical protein